MKRLSNTEIKEMAMRIEMGERPRDVCGDAGITSKEFYLRRKELPPEKEIDIKKLPKNKLKRIKELHGEGLTSTVIAKRVHMKLDIVNQAIIYSQKLRPGKNSMRIYTHVKTENRKKVEFLYDLKYTFPQIKAKLHISIGAVYYHYHCIKRERGE